MAEKKNSIVESISYVCRPIHRTIDKNAFLWMRIFMRITLIVQNIDQQEFVMHQSITISRNPYWNSWK